MRRWLGLSFAFLAGAPLLGVLLFVTFQPVKVLPRLQLAPGFVLVDQDGAPVTSDSLRGALTLYSFSYARCGGACESPAPLLGELQAALAQEDLGVPVRLVTVTVDPEHDTPAVLRAYGQQVGADFTRWSFLTGPAPAVAALVTGGFDVFAKPQTDGTLILDTRLWLVDGWGIKRAEYSSYWPAPARVLRDLRLVAAEARNSAGWAKYAYDAAHFFGCYSE
ncbi:MAG: SCO family protein [Anaerolineales bacterium]|nr:SCO family protein [Anaerolineales bacterium]